MRRILCAVVVLLVLCSAVIVCPGFAAQSSRPEVEFIFDKDSVNVGESISVRYEITGAASYSDILFRWYVYDEDGNEVLYERLEATGLTGSAVLTPMYGMRLNVDMIITDATGMMYFFDSRNIPVIGSVSKKPEVKFTFDRDSVAVGESIGLRYEITGAGSYPEVILKWHVHDKKGNEVLLKRLETTGLTGNVVLTPTCGAYLNVDMIITDDVGMQYFFDSENIPITGDPSQNPDVKFVFDCDSAQVGEKIGIRYEITGEGNYTDVLFRWHIYDEKGNEVLHERLEATGLSGGATLMPMFGFRLNADIIVTEDTGMMYFFTSENLLICDRSDDAVFVLPESMTVVDAEAFAGTDCEKVWCPATLVRVGARAFAGCTELRLIVIPAENADIAEDAFEGCSPDLVIAAPRGSNAHIFAMKAGFEYKEI